VCRHCARPVDPSPADLAWLDGDAGRPLCGAGCERCGNSGYAGRTAITELFLPDDETAAAIRGGAGLAELLRLARAAGFHTMTEDGQRKVRAGITTRSEVERVNRHHRFDRDEREAV
jgi:type II secretory ATPase GspE/PulE/Tfp pilus assembly ATPase PilB-like protein